MHPSVRSLLDFFEFDSVPPQEVSRRFTVFARTIAERSPDHPETAVALRKLLEARDCAVRAALFQAVAT